MDITSTSNLSAKAQYILRDVDKIIEAYQLKPTMTIELWPDKYDALEKSVKKHLCKALEKHTYRGYKLTRKAKRARDNKKNIREIFE